jgi:hypothetical protein
MNLEFASKMRRSRHKYTFEGSIPLDDEEEGEVEFEIEVEVGVEAEAEVPDEDDDNASEKSSLAPEVLLESEALD